MSTHTHIHVSLRTLSAYQGSSAPAADAMKCASPEFFGGRGEEAYRAQE